MMARFTGNPDEAPIIDGENGARRLPYRLQVGYPLTEFMVWDIKE